MIKSIEQLIDKINQLDISDSQREEILQIANIINKDEVEIMEMYLIKYEDLREPEVKQWYLVSKLYYDFISGKSIRI